MLPAIGLVFAVQPALAQNISVPTKPAQPPQRHIDVTVEGDALYDTNVARSDEARAAQRGLKREDARFTPRATLDLYVPVGNSSFTATGSGAYDFYARNSRLNGERLYLDTGFSTSVAICQADLSAGISRVRSDLGDLGLTTIGSSYDFNNIETTKTVGATLTCGHEVGLHPLGQIQYRTGANTNAIRRGSDYNTLTYGTGVAYSQPSIGTFMLLFGEADTRFPRREGDPTLYDGLQKFQARSVGAAFSRAVTPTFQASVQVNYTRVDTDFNIRSFKGMTWDASVMVVPGGRLKLEGTLSRSAVPTLAYDVDYYVQTLYGISATYPLTTRLSLNAGYSLRKRDYYSSVAVPLHQLTDDTVNLAQGGLLFTQSQRLSFGLLLAYEDRKANDRYYDYDSFRTMFTARLKF